MAWERCGTNRLKASAALTGSPTDIQRFLFRGMIVYGSLGFARDPIRHVDCRIVSGLFPCAGVCQWYSGGEWILQRRLETGEPTPQLELRGPARAGCRKSCDPRRPRVRLR